MFFKQLHTRDSSLSYLFGCAGLGKAIAVDVVAGDEDWFVEQAKMAGAQITHVIDTHVHADHLSGGRSLARRVDAPYCLHEAAREFVHFDFEALHDEQLIDVGNVTVRVLHTPGHTPDSMCLLVTDKRRGDVPWFVLTGDTLFVGAVGRPDLAGHEREMAGALYDSLHTRLLSLPGEMEIYPGHQAGSACGAGLSAKPASTLAFEKRFNPMLGLSRAAFVDQLTTETPPRPANMDRIVAANVAA
ncbi:MBL fold metallo-hydrolase [Pandoraea sp.]|uniref:MBL fold metallo-hydrolase n=1 Tax=Pandoraea sp. TaxID=1883445 RepID=UPI0011F7434D|nr:MBL fold metallo-hydrolase [Pandoraea sp.]TAL54540.1 MAG: MBL fold metallo-hydrolase [Pandoraea sp.]TAM15760.1 MAG: MBL fold metallo-hydrolase [Pandoraea sp.]